MWLSNLRSAAVGRGGGSWAIAGLQRQRDAPSPPHIWPEALAGQLKCTQTLPCPGRQAAPLRALVPRDAPEACLALEQPALAAGLRGACTQERAGSSVRSKAGVLTGKQPLGCSRLRSWRGDCPASWAAAVRRRSSARQSIAPTGSLAALGHHPQQQPAHLRPRCSQTPGSARPGGPQTPPCTAASQRAPPPRGSAPPPRPRCRRRCAQAGSPGSPRGRCRRGSRQSCCLARTAARPSWLPPLSRRPAAAPALPPVDPGAPVDLARWVSCVQPGLWGR